jgi:zinc transporter
VTRVTAEESGVPGNIRGPDVGSTDGLCWERQFAAEETPGQLWKWKHYDLVHAQAHLSIDADAALSSIARRVLTGMERRARIVIDGDTVAGTFPAFAHIDGADNDEPVFWHFAMTPTYLVTGRRRATRTLFAVLQLAEGGLHPRCPATFIDLCIASFAEEIRARLTSIDEVLAGVEDAVVGQPASSNLTELSGQLGRARRAVVRLARIVSPLARLLQLRIPSMPGWAQSPENDAAYRAIHETVDDITALQERARALHDELTSLFSDETNRRLYLVSIVTTLLMPAAFITGFFGMNTGGMPWSGDGATFGTLLATAVCAIAVVITLAFLRWRRLL